MPEIGETLREARMRRRIDMTDVEAATKIRAKYLRALESEEWEEQPGLPARDEPADSSGALRRLGSGECQDPIADVRIALLVIGIRVMAIVRVHPPAVAEPDEHVAQYPTEGVVQPVPGEDRLVPRVVAVSRSGRGARSTRPCRPRRSAA